MKIDSNGNIELTYTAKEILKNYQKTVEMTLDNVSVSSATGDALNEVAQKFSCSRLGLPNYPTPKHFHLGKKLSQIPMDKIYIGMKVVFWDPRPDKSSSGIEWHGEVVLKNNYQVIVQKIHIRSRKKGHFRIFDKTFGEQYSTDPCNFLYFEE